jgi:hypothetical protein
MDSTRRVSAIRSALNKIATLIEFTGLTSFSKNLRRLWLPACYLAATLELKHSKNPLTSCFVSANLKTRTYQEHERLIVS